MLKFENQLYFYLFFLLPVLLGLFLIARYQMKRRIKKIGDAGLLGKLMPMRSFRRPWLKLTLLMLAICSVILAIINPQIGFRTEEVKRDGIDMVIALDVSRSMLAEDVRPNRMERSRLAVSRFIDRLENDRVGLVLFAGTAVTQVPVTADHQAAKMILRTANTNSIQLQGTAISGAIERAVASFSGQDMRNKVIVIVSDGENHMDDPAAAARQAHQQGIVIHTIGVGTQQGAPIPVYRNNQIFGFLRDNTGNTVMSRFDEATLRAIAQAGGGSFHTGTGPDLGLNKVLQEIRQMEAQEYEVQLYSAFESRFHYFVALALIFLLLELLIFERKNWWVERIQFFQPHKPIIRKRWLKETTGKSFKFD